MCSHSFFLPSMNWHSLSLLLLYAVCVSGLKEFSLARYNETAVYANNSVIDVNLIGEGYYPFSQSYGGALECHTDDTNCCSSLDTPDGIGRGEWYDPYGYPLPGGRDINNSYYGFYRVRDHMVLRLNRRDVDGLTGLYRCEIPGAGEVTITRYITLINNGSLCADLSPLSKGGITYTPPTKYYHGKRYIGTIASLHCLSQFELVSGSIHRICGPNGTWNGTEPSCQLKCPIVNPANGQVSVEDITATYTCDTGYALNGENTIICQSDGTWTYSEPTCQIRDCGPLTAPANGQVDTSSGTTFGSTATYTCDTGYTIFGVTTTTCDADGNWNSTLIPACEQVIIQLRFGQLDCVHYRSSDSLEKITDISAELVDNVVRLCSCHFNSNFLLDPQLQCFPESPQTVTFRAQLSSTGVFNASTIALYVKEWIVSSQHFTLNGVRLSFNKTCALVISSFDVVECPVTAVKGSTIAIPVLVGGTCGGLVLIMLLIGAVALCYCCKRKLTKDMEQKQKNQDKANAGGDSVGEENRKSVEYEETDDVREDPRTWGQQHAHKGNYELTQCTAYKYVKRNAY